MGTRRFVATAMGRTAGGGVGYERWFVGALLALVVVYSAGLWWDGFYSVAVNSIYHLPWIAAALVAPFTIYRTRGRQRLAWCLVAGLIVTWGIAELFYSYYSLAGTELPFPGPADGFYFAGYLFLIAALAMFASGFKRRGDVRAVLDGLTLLIVVGALSWQFFVKPVVASTEGGAAAGFTAMGYPLMDLGVMTVLVMAVYLARARPRLPLIALAMAVVLSLFGDSAYMLLTLHFPDADFAHRLLEPLWMAVYVAFVVALLAGLNEPAAEDSARSPGESRLALALPYLAVVPLVAIAVSYALTGQDAAVLVTGALAATATMMARQWLTVSENLRLQAELKREMDRSLVALHYRETLLSELATKADQLEQARQEALHLADHDGLTGLLNHRAWFREAIGLRPLAMAVFDVDHFKRVNDSHGHPAGDLVLRLVAARLAEVLPPGTVLGRLGGEEFAALMFLSLDEAATSCEATVARLAAEPVRLPTGGAVALTISAGIAGWRVAATAQESVERTYEAADAALYEAKANGRSRVAVAA